MLFTLWLRTETRHAMREAQRKSKPAGRHATFRPRLEALEGRDLPSTLTVTSNLDNGAPGTLRAEIAAARAGDTITVGPSVTGTIMLAQGELAISKNLTIQGPAASLVGISGHSDQARVFEVDGASTTVTLSGLGISGGVAANASTAWGQSGGGILNYGVLTGNSASVKGGGLFNYKGGTLTVLDSFFSNNTPDNIDGKYTNKGGNILQ